MDVSDEMLMAYVDGELDASARVSFEEAIAADPELARRVSQQQKLRRDLRDAFNDVRKEPVPERLLAAARTAPEMPEVADLATARASKAAKAERAATRRWSWPQLGAIAASVALGIIIGQFFWHSPELAPFGTKEGRLVARADLADALTHQLASTQSPEAAVQIGVSFRSQAGEYCRTFVARESGGIAGLACREGDDWALKILARSKAAAGEVRTAAGAIPAAVMQTVDEQISGEPLDSNGEAAAAQSGWHK